MSELSGGREGGSEPGTPPVPARVGGVAILRMVALAIGAVLAVVMIALFGLYVGETFWVG